MTVWAVSGLKAIYPQQSDLGPWGWGPYAAEKQVATWMFGALGGEAAYMSFKPGSGGSMDIDSFDFTLTNKFGNSQYNDYYNLQQFHKERRVTQKGQVSQVKFALNVLLDGRRYHIPELWWVQGEGNDGMVLSNWGTCDPLHVTTDGSQITVYGYEDGVASREVDGKPGTPGRRDKPVALQLQVVSGRTKFMVLNPIAGDSPWDVVDEFQFRLARKLVDIDYADSLTRFMLDDRYKVDNPQEHYWFLFSLDAFDLGELTGDTAMVDQDTLVINDYKEYVNVTTMRNGTAATTAMKTSDYAHAITNTFTYQRQYQHAHKETKSASLKVSTKITVPIVKQEFNVEATGTMAFEDTDTDTESKTWANTDTRTFTVSGQTFNIPPHEMWRLQMGWTRCSISGVTRVLFPFHQGFTVVAQDWGGGGAGGGVRVKVPIDMKAMAQWLGMKSVHDTDDGVNLVATYRFTSDVGVVGDYSVDTLPYPTQE